MNLDDWMTSTATALAQLMAQGQNVEFTSSGPAFRCILAINNYIATGDLVGSGVFHQIADKTVFVIPVNRSLVADLLDFAKLQAKLQLISNPKHQLESMGQHNHFDMWTLSVANQDLDDFSYQLASSPSSKGWGTCRDATDSPQRPTG